MESDISTALTLLAIGMITVFVVLLLVVLTGNVLIRLVNRLDASIPRGGISPQRVSSQQIAAITAAVEAVTEGRGKIESIKKL